MCPTLRTALCTLLLWATLTTAASTQDVPSGQPPRAQQAKILFNEGLEHARAGEWREALRAFSAARVLVERPNVVFNLAVAHYQLREFGSAQRALDDFARLAKPENPNRTEAERLTRLIAPKVASLVLSVEPGSAVVKLDGKRVPWVAGQRIALDPGAHRVEASHEGHRTQRLELSLHAGERSERHLALERLEPATGRPAIAAATQLAISADAATDTTIRSDGSAEDETRLGPYLLLGGGGVLLTGALITGILTTKAEGELEDMCDDDVCDERDKDTADRGKTLKTTTNILLAAGGAAALGGGLWWLLASGDDDDPESMRAALWCTTAGCQTSVAGRF